MSDAAELAELRERYAVACRAWQAEALRVVADDAIAEVESLQGELADAEQERDEARAAEKRWDEMYQELHAELTAAEAKAKRLADVLEPLAGLTQTLRLFMCSCRNHGLFAADPHPDIRPLADEWIDELEEQHYAIGAALSETAPAEGHAGELERLGDELERVRVQLAGCACAAQGHISDPATKGMYGWSPAYQDVLELRRGHDALVAAAPLAEGPPVKPPLAEFVRRLEDWHEPTAPFTGVPTPGCAVTIHWTDAYPEHDPDHVIDHGYVFIWPAGDIDLEAVVHVPNPDGTGCKETPDPEWMPLHELLCNDRVERVVFADGPPVDADELERLRRVEKAFDYLALLCESNKPVITGAVKGAPPFWVNIRYWIGKGREPLAADAGGGSDEGD